MFELSINLLKTFLYTSPNELGSLFNSDYWKIVKFFVSDHLNCIWVLSPAIVLAIIKWTPVAKPSVIKKAWQLLGHLSAQQSWFFNADSIVIIKKWGSILKKQSYTFFVISNFDCWIRTTCTILWKFFDWEW